MNNELLRIKDVLREHNKTLTQAAEAMGVTCGSLSAMLNGNPTLETLSKFSIAVGCNIRDLFK